MVNAPVVFTRLGLVIPDIVNCSRKSSVVAVRNAPVILNTLPEGVIVSVDAGTVLQLSFAPGPLMPLARLARE